MIKELIDAGFVSPQTGTGNSRRFTLQDLMLLRTARALHDGKIPPKKIRQALTKLKAELPDEIPLTGLRITAIGADVVVSEGTTHRVAESGQLVMDFEVAVVGGQVAFLPSRTPEAKTEVPDVLVARGLAIEPTDPAQAEAAYRQALDLAPDYVDAYLNLGALLCDRQRGDEALELYQTAFAKCEECASLHFNCAVALEDLGKFVAAVQEYKRCLELDPAVGDAHFNIGRIQEVLGDKQAALRHFSEYRRLQTC